MQDYYNTQKFAKLQASIQKFEMQKNWFIYKITMTRNLIKKLEQKFEISSSQNGPTETCADLEIVNNSKEISISL